MEATLPLLELDRCYPEVIYDPNGLLPVPWVHPKLELVGLRLTSR